MVDFIQDQPNKKSKMEIVKSYANQKSWFFGALALVIIIGVGVAGVFYLPSLLNVFKSNDQRSANVNTLMSQNSKLKTAHADENLLPKSFLIGKATIVHFSPDYIEVVEQDSTERYNVLIDTNTIIRYQNLPTSQTTDNAIVKLDQIKEGNTLWVTAANFAGLESFTANMILITDYDQQFTRDDL